MNHELTPQDTAMADFRLFFQPALIRCNISDDGKIMKFRLSGDRLDAELLGQARRIIRENGLPLEAKIEEWKAAGVIFDRWLTIVFDQTQLVPEAY